MYILMDIPILRFFKSMSKTWNLVDDREPWNQCLIEDLRWGIVPLGTGNDFSRVAGWGWGSLSNGAAVDGG